MSQSYATHRRMDPWYHYAAFALWIAATAMAIRHLTKGREDAGFQLVLMAFLLIVLMKVRLYALRVQDRVIRLEETLRMKALLSPDLQDGIHRLTPAQMVALRFASDGELQARVGEALRENLAPEAIKKRIEVWRPDEFRV
jgi:hypothetical protein